MAVPKRKTTPSRKRKRHLREKQIIYALYCNYAICTFCNKLLKKHHVCAHCNTYGDKQLSSMK